jgi:rhodanese-related sulfurtransferase
MKGKCLIRIDPATLHAWLACGDTALIDVREPHEFAREHIAGARLLPLSQMDARSIPAGMRIVLCCAGGCRSQTAARRLGLSGLAHLEGGLAAWTAAGFATVEQQAPRAVTVDHIGPPVQLA